MPDREAILAVTGKLAAPFDLAMLDQGLLTVLGNATGHGIGPALSVTQMHTMLRMAFRLGAFLVFAQGTPQEDVITLVPVKREATG